MKGASMKNANAPLVTSDTVEINFGFLRQAVGEGACRVLSQDGAVNTWTDVLRKAKVNIHELAAGVNLASDRGAPPFDGVSLAWFMGLIREYRIAKAAEAKPLPKNLDAMKEAKTAPEHRAWTNRLKDILRRGAAAEKDSPERLAVLKELQYELHDPKSYCGQRGWCPKTRGFASDIERIEKKLANETAATQRDEKFVAEAKGEAKPEFVEDDEPPF